MIDKDVQEAQQKQVTEEMRKNAVVKEMSDGILGMIKEGFEKSKDELAREMTKSITKHITEPLKIYETKLSDLQDEVKKQEEEMESMKQRIKDLETSITQRW